MKIAIRTRLPTKWNMNINTRQRIVNLLFKKITAVRIMNICTKKIRYFTALVCMMCMLHLYCFAQKNPNPTNLFTLAIHYKDTAIGAEQPSLKTSFDNILSLYNYANTLPQLLSTKGYPTASVDSSWQIGDTLHVHLYIGTKYNWVQLRTVGIEKNMLSKSGYSENDFINKPLNIAEISSIKEKLLSVYENEGYPFALIYLDSVSIIENKVSATLTVNKILLYKIDSIKNYGKLKINAKFLQRYLSISNGSIYNLEKLKDVDRKLLDLPFAMPVSMSSLNLLGTGAILNINVNSKKSSEASAIFGFLPDANNTGKFQLTGDVNLDLKNVFGAGEGLLLKYQSLQPKSPRLNLGYEKPYIFRSPFGISFLFEFFKKDSSFLQVNAQLALQLSLSKYQNGKIIVQWQNNNLLQGGIDTNAIRQQKKLPEIIDVKSVNVGINYEYRNTNYRFNPIKGNEINLSVLAGLKNIQPNNDILSLKLPGFNFASLYDSLKLSSYQIKLKLSAIHFFQLSKSSACKVALHTGIYSSPAIFRNEVFQIGGYKLLRGFDEESIYATQYAVVTAEYRFLTSLNSYIFGFIDAGNTKKRYQSISNNNYFTSTGVGIVYETKAGLLNLSLALGKRNDIPFNIRQASKIHFGYINYF
jgi:outer membrane protein assembly factor BamA